jgi:hypothetical protein
MAQSQDIFQNTRKGFELQVIFSGTPEKDVQRTLYELLGKTITIFDFKWIGSLEWQADSQKKIFEEKRHTDCLVKDGKDGEHLRERGDEVIQGLKKIAEKSKVDFIAKLKIHSFLPE